MTDRNWAEPYNGHLQKRGDKGPVKRWRRRFFTLISNVLYYFKEENIKEPLGKIDLYTAISIHPSTDSEGSYFQIDCPNRIYYLLADTKDQAQRWIDILNQSKKIHGDFEKRTSAIEDHPFVPSAPPFDFSPISDNSDNETSSVCSSTSMESVSYPEIVHYQNFAQQHNYYQPPSIHGDFYKYPYANLTENHIKEYYFTEGIGLRQYVDQFVQCCKVVLNSSNVVSQDFEDKKKVLCVYLALRTLDWDNRDRFAAFSVKGYEGEVFHVLYTSAIGLAQKRILATWPLDAPTIVTKIDTWVKRKKSLQQILFQHGDKESILKWNIALLFYVKQQFLSVTQFVELEHSVTGLMNALHFELGLLPSVVFANKLWSTINTSMVPESDKVHLKNLLEASLVMQKLKLDNDFYGFTKRDPLLANKFETVLCEFPQTKSKTALYPQAQVLRTSEMKIFGQWTASLLEHNPNQPQQPYVVFLKNQRILKRLAVKVNKAFYPKLQDELLLCAIAIEERMPTIEQIDSTVPYPESNGDEILVDLVNSLHL